MVQSSRGGASSAMDCSQEMHRGSAEGLRASSLSSMRTRAILGLNLRSHCCAALTLSRDFHDPNPPVSSKLSCMCRSGFCPHREMAKACSTNEASRNPCYSMLALTEPTSPHAASQGHTHQAICLPQRLDLQTRHKAGV